MNEQILGILRALVPAIVAYLVGRGIIPEGYAADVTAFLIAAAAALWSWYSNSRVSQVASVAAMSGTTVSPNGKQITITDTTLAKAAAMSATSASGK